MEQPIQGGIPLTDCEELEIPATCDYSLHSVELRAARAGDKLVVASFAYTWTRGSVALGNPGVALCLRPGTDLVFDNDIKWGALLSMFFRKRRASGRLARFRQVSTERMDTRHDAIGFPDGEVVLLTSFRLGQKATIIQLPVSQSVTEQSNRLVIDLVPMQGVRSVGSGWFFTG